MGFVRLAGGLVHGGSKRPPRRLKRIENNIGNRQFRIVPTIDSALHHVAQFANIPGPLISFQRSHCVLRKARPFRPAQFRSHAPPEVIGQYPHIALPVAKRWQSDNLERKPVEQISAESSRFHRCRRSEEHTSELQSLMRITYAVFCLKKKKCTHTSQ